VLAVFLMRFRIDVGGDRFVDTRVIPIALATLIEGPVAGAVTAAIAVGYRIWLGGSGAVAGVLGIVATTLAAAAVRALGAA
jgi:LytS/YehU family sensor histidine kinase